MRTLTWAAALRASGLETPRDIAVARLGTPDTLVEIMVVAAQ